MKFLSLSEVAARVAKLKPGQRFNVESENERKYALAAGRCQGKDIITRRRPGGSGFAIISVDGIAGMKRTAK